MRAVGSRNEQFREVGARCRHRYGRHQCCLNQEHTRMGFMHLSVDGGGDIFEWWL